MWRSISSRYSVTSFLTTPVSSSSEGAKVTLLHFFCKKISLDALLLRFSQKVTQAELFASARFTRICKTSPFLLENGYCRFLSFMACGGKTLPYSRKRNRRFLILRQVFPYSQKAGFLRGARFARLRYVCFITNEWNPQNPDFAESEGSGEKAKKQTEFALSKQPTSRAQAGFHEFFLIG